MSSRCGCADHVGDGQRSATCEATPATGGEPLRLRLRRALPAVRAAFAAAASSGTARSPLFPPAQPRKRFESGSTSAGPATTPAPEQPVQSPLLRGAGLPRSRCRRRGAGLLAAVCARGNKVPNGNSEKNFLIIPKQSLPRCLPMTFFDRCKKMRRCSSGITQSCSPSKKPLCRGSRSQETGIKDSKAKGGRLTSNRGRATTSSETASPRSGRRWTSWTGSNMSRSLSVPARRRFSGDTDGLARVPGAVEPNEVLQKKYAVYYFCIRITKNAKSSFCCLLCSAPS